MALVLDRKTALVSPQFHVNFDPSFHTVSQDEFDMGWQTKAGFVGQREIKTPPTPFAETSELKRQQNVEWNLAPEEVTNLKAKRRKTNHDAPINGNEEASLPTNDLNQTNDMIQETQ